MSKTQGFDAFLNESAELLESAKVELTESYKGIDEATLNEAKLSQDDAVAAFEEALGGEGVKTGKVDKTGDLGGGTKTFSYKVKLSDKQAAAIAKKLQAKSIFVSNMSILSKVLVSYQG